MKIPDQIVRLSVPVVLITAGFMIGRSYLVPATFGELGHYRAAAVNEVASKNIRYAGREACALCHPDIVEVKRQGYHRDVGCEVCHGPAYNHTQDPVSHTPSAPRARGYCPLCHGYLPARPTGSPQIIAETHNPPKPCMSCHNPHDPKPPTVPGECSACHGRIARAKAVSHHANLECTICHQTAKEHKMEPRRFRPVKPVDRSFCGQCHAGKGTEGALKVGLAEYSKEAPKVSLSEHYPEFLCWQCHYPHQPEAD